MVFNWFRRQFSTSDVASEETGSEPQSVEQEQQALEQPDIAQPLSQSTSEASSPAISEDYLNWAKAAYKNIQQRQQPSVAPEAITAAESPESAEPAEAIDQLDISQPLESTETTVSEADAATQSESSVQAEAAVTPTDIVPEEPTTPELPEADAHPPATEVHPTETDVSPTAPAQAAATDSTAVEPAIAQTEVNTTPEAESPTISVADEGSEITPAPVPIWARQSDLQARMARLKETAIELPEPEPQATVQPIASSKTTTDELEKVPGLAFDEGFLWSAEVLAAQGRSPEDVSIEEISWLKRLRQGLDKTRRSLVNQLKAIVGQGPLNQDAVMEIEALLLQADTGVEATDYIINTLQQKLREEVLPPEQAIIYLKQILRDLLDQPFQESYSPTFVPEKETLNIWLMTGVNGAGKTTTIGKIAHLAQKSDYRCLIAAADTFRAAAVEQVKIWGERSGTEVIANPGKNTDPAAVVYDAIAAAKARQTELLLVDTAGRLQNKKNLMEELAKIRRIIDKQAPDAKVEALLVLDATLGQNGLRQAEVFSEAAKLSGVVLTKLDGTAKGGVALAVVQQLALPIRFIGAGEGIEDLRPFSSYEFVEALLSG